MNESEKKYEDIIKLLAKLSCEDRSRDESAQAYERLAEEVDGPLAALISESSYPLKSSLKAKIDSVLAEAEIFVRYPFLYGKTTVGIVGVNKDFFLGLLKENAYAAFARKKELPCIVYQDEIANKISATNHAGNVIGLTDGEFINANRLQQCDESICLQISDILESYAISARLKYPSANFALFPAVDMSPKTEYGRIAKLCTAFFVFCNSYLHGLPRDILEQSVPVYLVKTQNCSEYNRVVAEIRNSDPERVIRTVTPDEADGIMAQLDRKMHNMLLADSLLAAMLELLEHSVSAADAYQQNESLLNADTVFSEGRNAETIGKLIRKERELSSFESSQKEKTENVIREVLRRVRELERTLQEKALPDMELAHSEDEIGYALGYADLIRQIIFSYIRCGNTGKAEQYINRLRKTDALSAEIFMLYVYERDSKPLPEQAYELLQNHKTELEARRALVHFASRFNLNSAERDELAYSLPEKIMNADELYYSALYMERKGRSNRTVRRLESAYQAGSREAGNRLVEIYRSRNDYGKIKGLADGLIPEAAFLYGKHLSEIGTKYAQSVTYLRIAASMEHIPAIKYYADMLYDEIQNADIYNDISEKISVAIGLYRFLLKKKETDDFTIGRIGVLYHRCGEYGKAKAYLERGVSSAPAFPRAAYCLGWMYLNGDGVARNYQLAKKYLTVALNGGVWEAKAKLDAANENIGRAKTQNSSDPSSGRYSKNQDYSPTYKQVSVSDQSCFITTATCLSEGKEDDCDELTAFRRYRDEVLLTSDEGRELVRTYYRIAPAIVERISKEPDCGEIYHRLYEQYIAPGYELLRAGRGDEAKRLYEEGVRMLAGKYLADT